MFCNSDVNLCDPEKIMGAVKREQQCLTSAKRRELKAAMLAK